jgi:hypothetical protein
MMPATTIDGVVGMWEILADGGRRGSDAKTPEAALHDRAKHIPVKTYQARLLIGGLAC